MRRAVTALALAVVLLTAAACGTDRSPQPATSGPVAAPAPAGSAPGDAPVRALCETLGKAYSDHLGPFAEALSATVAGSTASRDANAQKQARQQLTGLADAITEATRGNPDKQVQADGVQAAEQIRKASADDGFFKKITSPDDVNKVMGTTMTTWLSPVARHCS